MAPAPDPDQTTLTNAEKEMIQKIADRDGVTLEEAASRLTTEALKRRVKKRTGKAPARVYPMKRETR